MEEPLHPNAKPPAWVVLLMLNIWLLMVAVFFYVLCLDIHAAQLLIQLIFG
jgi:hypothetical protein